jgi:pyruvate dehydrogenase E2 component (dihydrolipoamide acetyltransferase)
VSDFTLPELGENVAAGDVLRVLVKAGDEVARDQPVLELETDKATIEVPSSVEGRVKDVKVKAGDKVKVGQLILSVEDGAAAKAAADEGEGETEKGGQTAAAPATAAGANAAAKVPSDDQGLEQHVEGRQRPAADKADRPATAAPAASRKVVDINRGSRPVADSSASELPVAPAAPSVRRMARELGVDVNQVPGSGPDGRVSIDDVKAHAKRLLSSAGSGSHAADAGEPLPDFSRWGTIERRPMRAVRRKTAEHLSAAWKTIPHVTQHDLADVTALEELRKRYSKEVEAAGGSLTVTSIAVKIVASALKVFPQFNVSLDIAAQEIVQKKYVNVGVAVDTDRGLLVPVIRDADAKNVVQLSLELTQLAEKARTRKISLDDMQGGCFSISNLGGIGGTFFTPIVNPPEVAILGISRAKMEPVYDKETKQFMPRLMLPLSLSYDHRAVDGADGVRFLKWIVEAFEQPFLLALHG